MKEAALLLLLEGEALTTELLEALAETKGLWLDQEVLEALAEVMGLWLGTEAHALGELEAL